MYVSTLFSGWIISHFSRMDIKLMVYGRMLVSVNCVNLMVIFKIHIVRLSHLDKRIHLRQDEK